MEGHSEKNPKQIAVWRKKKKTHLLGKGMGGEDE